MAYVPEGWRCVGAEERDMTVLDLTRDRIASFSTPTEESLEENLVGDLRRWSLRAIALLSVLNVLDVVLTKTFIRAGFQEGNPLMAGLVQDWRMGAIKAIILGALFLKTFTSRPNVTRACLLWAAVGVYGLASYVNFQAIQQIPQL
jgi:hypothetical protein